MKNVRYLTKIMVITIDIVNYEIIHSNFDNSLKEELSMTEIYIFFALSHKCFKVRNEYSLHYIL